MTPSSLLKWHPLELFERRFQANLGALQTRDPLLAGRLRDLRVLTPFFIAAEGDQVFLGRPGAAGMEIVPNIIPPAQARSMAAKLFPKNALAWPAVIAGLAYGWFWDRVAKLPCQVDAAPGHRPPVYFLAGDIERLWAILHVMDWAELLADARFPIFAGVDAVAQLRAALIENPTWPLPKACVNAEPGLWNEDFNTVVDAVTAGREARLAHIRARLDAVYSGTSPDEWAAKFQGGRLRVLGITSRYTTFLQHSMRDWLAAFDRLEHETRLFIESADHLIPGPTGYAQGILDFKPDLILIIDHYRAELGRVPQSVPCVMWVQDRLPNIYSAGGAAAQGPRDFVLGSGRLHLAERFGYPRERFMSSTVGINEEKFANQAPTADEIKYFGCDVSYVSHSSTPADVLVRQYLAGNPNSPTAKLVWDLHDRMVAHFENGGEVLAEPVLRRHLTETREQLGLELNDADAAEILYLFGQQVNNAIFRHQALEWVAQSGADLRLYGRGWGNHPTLARFARGEADNRHDLVKIYRTSKINLQLIPHGAVHQRLLDGLAAGGFFLMRYTPGDALGIPYVRLWKWCQRREISSDAEMRYFANEEALDLIGDIDRLQDYDTVTVPLQLFDCLSTIADQDFTTLGGSLWPALYPEVSFRNEAELRSKLEKYLSNDTLRRDTATGMRQVVIDRCSYKNISDRLVRFIGEHLRSEAGHGDVDAKRAA